MALAILKSESHTIVNPIIFPNDLYVQMENMYIKYDYSIIDESNRKVIDFINLYCSSVDVSLNNI
jgi:hypothetical protein